MTATGKANGQAGAAWFTVATDWNQAGFGPGLTSFNPAENTITPAKAADPQAEVQRQRAGESERGDDDGIVCIGTGNGGVEAFAPN